MTAVWDPFVTPAIQMLTGSEMSEDHAAAWCGSAVLTSWIARLFVLAETWAMMEVPKRVGSRLD